jgi:hypothetical protein
MLQLRSIARTEIMFSTRQIGEGNRGSFLKRRPLNPICKSVSQAPAGIHGPARAEI